MSFVGPATIAPKDRDVIRFLDAIRSVLKKRSESDRLRLVTHVIHSVAEYTLLTFGHRETLAIIAEVKTKLEAKDVGRISPFH